MSDFTFFLVLSKLLQVTKEPMYSNRTMLASRIWLVYSSSPDALIDNRLLYWLYAHNQNDAELELAYLVWCSFNHEVAPNKLTPKNTGKAGANPFPSRW
jgi:hypothetical protein